MTIKLDQRNYRKHSQKNKDLINKSLKECGAGRSIVIDNEDNIIAGNGIFEQSQKLGIKPRIIESDGSELIVVKRTDLATNDEKRKQLAIMDNSTSDSSEFDFELLQEDFDIETIKDYGIDFKFEIEDSKEVVEDEIPENVDTKCKRGDIWKLGDHRLMCGDSTKVDDVEKLMNGKKADITFTSPPYNGDNKISNGDVFAKKGNQKLYADGYEDNLDSEEYINFASSVLAICFQYTDGYIFWNVNYNSNSKFEYIKQIVSFLPNLIEQIAWKKSSAIPLKGCMRRGWEPIYLFSTNGKNINTDNVETNIWEISNTNSQVSNHKACFPVALPAKGISLVKKNTGIVFEPFGGSGSTLIACEQLNRRCYMMELDEHYCDVIIQRWENLTKQKAELIKD